MKSLYALLYFSVIFSGFNTGCSLHNGDFMNYFPPEIIPSVIPLSNSPQLLLDDYLVASMQGLSREMQIPVKHPSNPLIQQDYPWEDRAIELYGTVVYDETANAYRCWYRTTSDTIPMPEYNIGYAESADGIIWTKPMVSGEVLGGSLPNNVVMRNVHGVCVMDTPLDPNLDRRFKSAGGNKKGLSADGITWNVSDWPAAGDNDTATSFVWWKNEYLAYVRSQGTWQNGVMRLVGICTSPDFENWTFKVPMFQTDYLDGYPWTQPYGLSVTAYGDQLIGILWLLYLDQVGSNNRLGDMDTQLMVSRDGRYWNRVCNRETFLSPTPGTWDEGRLYPATTMFVRDDTIYIYYTGTNTRHGSGSFGVCGIGLATLPADRFVALAPTASGTSGFLMTKLLGFEGNRLIVNAALPGADAMRVAVTDEAGRELPGFEGYRSQLSVHDALRYEVVWIQDGSGIWTVAAALSSMPLRLRFQIDGGRLFAFQIIE